MELKYAIGVDVGGTRTKTGLVDISDGVVVGAEITPTIRDGSDQFLDALESTCKRLLAKAGIDTGQLAGVGIGVPGFVDQGIVDSVWDFMPFMEDYPLAQLVEERLSVPCRVDNDARIVALGEARYGAAIAGRRSITLTLGTGLGFAMVIDGALSQTAPVDHMAGHIKIRNTAARCYCGQTGCLEMLVAAPGLVGAMNSTIEQKGTVSAEDTGAWTAEKIFAAAVRGHIPASEVVEQFLNDLATGINNFIFLFAPDIIVLGGGLAMGLEPYLSRLESKIFAAPYKSYRVELVPAILMEHGGILGSAALCFSHESRSDRKVPEGPST